MNASAEAEDPLTYTFSKYSKDSKLISNCTTLSIVLLFIFVITPLGTYYNLSFICKLLVFIVLTFALYKNLHITYKFTKASNVSYLDGSWSDVKNNMICSYVYSIFIFVLIVTIIKSFF
uniref:Uncharacterized protein n=1 Tax=viral metagenome TaxID=1070528 RepID=A0A6C0KVE9_9ZZZZ